MTNSKLILFKTLMDIMESELMLIHNKLDALTNEKGDNQNIIKALQRVSETGMSTMDVIRPDGEKYGRLLLIDYNAFEDVEKFTDANGYINIKMKPTKNVTNSGVRWGNNSEGLKEGVIKVKGE